MFLNEVKVKGGIFKGQITGNWSKNSHYALTLSKVSVSTFSESDLNKAIEELILIRDMVADMNKKHKEDIAEKINNFFEEDEQEK